MTQDMDGDGTKYPAAIQLGVMDMGWVFFYFLFFILFFLFFYTF